MDASCDETAWMAARTENMSADDGGVTIVFVLLLLFPMMFVGGAPPRPIAIVVKADDDVVVVLGGKILCWAAMIYDLNILLLLPHAPPATATAYII